MKQTIHTAHAPAAIGPYSQAVFFQDVLYTSGQIGIIPETGELAAGIESQTKQALENLCAILAEAGASANDVLKTTVFLADMKDFSVVNKIYAQYFQDGCYPARSCVQVAALPKGALVEIECIAARKEEKNV